MEGCDPAALQPPRVRASTFSQGLRLEAHSARVRECGLVLLVLLSLSPSTAVECYQHINPPWPGDSGPDTFHRQTHGPLGSSSSAHPADLPPSPQTWSWCENWEGHIPETAGWASTCGLITCGLKCLPGRVPDVLSGLSSPPRCLPALARLLLPMSPPPRQHRHYQLFTLKIDI